jgi:hypothetical protein
LIEALGGAVGDRGAPGPVAAFFWRAWRYDDLHAAGKRRKRLGEIRNANCLQRYVDVALNIGIDRHEIISPPNYKPKPAR